MRAARFLLAVCLTLGISGCGSKTEDCDPGYEKNANGECVPVIQCGAQSCSGHGSCDASSGQIVCTCDPGYAGPTCASCAAGYHDDGSGVCLPDPTCDSSDCNDHGDCTMDGDQVVCTCHTGYAGDFCESCAAGYHLEGSECVADIECTADSCSGHGQCDASSGEVVCTCDTGYDGLHCEFCADGYVLQDDECVEMQVEDCINTIDDDLDNLTDCQDQDCTDHPWCGDEDCSDDFDNDGDEVLDCYDSDCAGTNDCEVCQATLEARCGDVLQGSTSGDNTITWYPECSEWEETGPEVIYHFVNDGNTYVDTVLSGMSVDLDIFVLENTCNPDTCKEEGNSQAYFEAHGGMDYYIVVDGNEGAFGDYTLTLTCE